MMGLLRMMASLLMSSVEEGGTSRSRGDTGIQLTQAQREFFQAGLANPADFPPVLLAWIEDQILSRLNAGNIDGFASRVWAPGDPKLVVEDLTGNTTEYVYTDNVGAWLYLNGTTVSRTDYSGIFAKYGTTFNTGGEAGTDFRLPDTRGRNIAACGLHANAVLGANDGVSDTLRQQDHVHAVGGVWDVGGALGAESAHTHGAGTYAITSLGTAAARVDPGAGSDIGVFPTIGTRSVTGTSAAGSSHTHSITGLSVTTGSVGTGMDSGDSGPYVYLGSIVAFIG